MIFTSLQKSHFVSEYKDFIDSELLTDRRLHFGGMVEFGLFCCYIIDIKILNAQSSKYLLK